MNRPKPHTRIVHRFTSVDPSGHETTEAVEGVIADGAYRRLRRHTIARPLRARDVLIDGLARDRSATAPTAATPPARPRASRALKGASRRSSARSGDSGHDDEPAEPSRRCKACGASIDHRGPRAQTCSDSCRVALHRKQTEIRVVITPVQDVTWATVDRQCGSWPQRSSRERARLIKRAGELGMALTDTQAGGLIEMSWSESPLLKLERIAGLLRARAEGYGLLEHAA